jgi:hypothetical protein
MISRACEVSRLTAGGGKKGASGPGSVSSGETASVSCFGRMICRCPGDGALALLPEASTTPIGPDGLWGARHVNETGSGGHSLGAMRGISAATQKHIALIPAALGRGWVSIVVHQLEDRCCRHVHVWCSEQNLFADELGEEFIRNALAISRKYLYYH